VLGFIESPAITEVSGIAASHRNRDVVYVHNDSGDAARFYALDRAARVVGAYELAGATLLDCEDIATALGFVFLADTGDNAGRTGIGAPRQSVAVYKVREPVIDTPTAAPSVQLLSSWSVLELRYPDRAHDAEALMIDPVSGALLLVTKEDHGPSLVFRAALDAKSPALLERVAEIPFGTRHAPGHYYATAGDISARGDAVLLRTYGSVLLFARTPGEPWSTTFARPATLSPSRLEPQGEAIAFAADGLGYFTVSEAARQPVFFFAAAAECR
jgi:hypothetical protein